VLNVCRCALQKTVPPIPLLLGVLPYYFYNYH
jgi:hypothetical protein